MNGVIVELRGKQAAALDEGGVVRRIPDRGYTVGQRVSLPKERRALRTVVAIAAAMALVLGLGTVAWATPAGTVSVDGGGSIEYTINCFDRVLSVTAVDEEGEALLEALDTDSLRHLSVDKAVAAAVEQLQEKAGPVLVAASGSGDNHTRRLCQGLEETMAEKEMVKARTVAVTQDDVASAHDQGITAGRLWAQRNGPAPDSDNAPADGEMPDLPDGGNFASHGPRGSGGPHNN